MNLTATEAKNRLGQVLEQAQREPVFIEKSGRRHSVVLSVEQYDVLLAQRQRDRPADAGKAFYAQYKDWVDMQNSLVEQAGIPGEEFRAW
jgi:prevent-host-death family protein